MHNFVPWSMCIPGHPTPQDAEESDLQYQLGCNTLSLTLNIDTGNINIYLHLDSYKEDYIIQW